MLGLLLGMAGFSRRVRMALSRILPIDPGSFVHAIALVASQLLSIGVEALWTTMGWPLTDDEAFSELIAYTLSPVGAVVMGVTAGLGEELAVRGVMQPRLGLVTSNLFFTALHALQYNWDDLVSVFLLGLLFGVVRRRTNTSTSAIVHGSYDFLVTTVLILEIPWFQ